MALSARLYNSTTVASAAVISTPRLSHSSAVVGLLDGYKPKAPSSLISSARCCNDCTESASPHPRAREALSTLGAYAASGRTETLPAPSLWWRCGNCSVDSGPLHNDGVPTKEQPESPGSRGCPPAATAFVST